uniref:Uncharacterized protein n=1 Tax=Strongyloides papillosus TaxID=174720 RepID=A0A0N5B4P3_STREA
MDTKEINVLVKPIPNGENNNENRFLAVRDLATSIEINSDVLLKDICKVILDKFGLGHLSPESEAFIDVQGSQLINCATFYPDKKINVDILQYLLGRSFTIVVFAHGKFQDFIELDEKRVAVNNLLDLLLRSYPFIKECIPSETVKDFIDSYMNGSIGSLSRDALTTVNKEMERLMNTLARNTEGSSTQSNNNNEKEVKTSLSPPSTNEPNNKDKDPQNENKGVFTEEVDRTPKNQPNTVKREIYDSQKGVSILKPNTESRRRRTGRILSYNMTTPRNVRFEDEGSTPSLQTIRRNQKIQSSYKTPLSRLSEVVNSVNSNVDQSAKSTTTPGELCSRRRSLVASEFINYTRKLTTLNKRSRNYRLSPTQINRLVRKRLALLNRRNGLPKEIGGVVDPNITL